MAKNPRIEPYIRTANTLDRIGLSKQADNVESLMRVGRAMSAGNPLFNNVEEHREYLELLREAKKLVSSQETNERTAGEKSFVLGEIDRYIELWSFMLEEDHKVRVAKKSLPFSLRLASNTGGQLTPEQLSMLDTIAPVFRNIWLNGIREEFGQSDVVFTPKELNSLGASMVKSHERTALDREDVSFRNFNGDMRKQLARAKKMSELDEQRSPEQIVQVQLEGLNRLQTPEARQITELLTSKQLEPMMQKVNSPQMKQQIASNAAALINWFLEPVSNNQSSVNLVEEKARMVGMPSDATLPADFFESPAGDPGTDGVRWFDENEISHLNSRSNPKYAINNTEASGSPQPVEEEKPLDEKSGPKDMDLETADSIPGLETDVAEQAQVQPVKKSRKKVIEAPVEVPDGLNAPTLGDPNEPIVNAIDKDIPGADLGMENTSVAEPVMPDELEPSESLGDEQSIEESQIENDDESDLLQFVEDIVSGIQGLEENPKATEEEISRIAELKSDIVMGGDRARVAIAILANVQNDVPILQNEPDKVVLDVLTETDDEDIEKICLLVSQRIDTADIATPVDEHAPGTEDSKPGQHDESSRQYPVDVEEEPADEYEYHGTWPVERTPMSPKLKNLMKWLAGMGLGAAAIWGIVSQLAPAGAAKEAINPMQSPQSEYSQPAQRAPEQPVYTPPVTQPEPQYTPPPPVQQPAPQVQQPAPQQQVPRQDTPKSWSRSYDDVWDTRK